MDIATIYRYLFACMLLWTFSMSAKAFNEIDAIVIWTKDRKSMSFLLEDSPKVSITEADIVVKSKQVEVYYPITDYLKFAFEKNHNGSNVESVFHSDRIYIQFTAKLAEIFNLTPNETISIYSINGVKEMSSKADSEGKISIPNLSSGIHILKANNTNFKFMIK